MPEELYPHTLDRTHGLVVRHMYVEAQDLKKHVIRAPHNKHKAELTSSNFNVLEGGGRNQITCGAHTGKSAAMDVVYTYGEFKGHHYMRPSGLDF